jgi:hypothetical protein
LTIPIDATFVLSLVSENDSTLRLVGKLVAINTGETPLEVGSIKLENQTITLQWESAAGQQFQIQSSTDLGAWQPEGTVTSATGTYSWSGTVNGQ